MKAQLLLKNKFTDEEENLFEQVVWRVPFDSMYREGVRYRLAFIPREMKKPVILYDNHHPKGHHKHLLDVEKPYTFLSVDQLLADFESDVNLWKKSKKRCSQ